MDKARPYDFEGQHPLSDEAEALSRSRTKVAPELMGSMTIVRGIADLVPLNSPSHKIVASDEGRVDSDALHLDVTLKPVIPVTDILYRTGYLVVKIGCLECQVESEIILETALKDKADEVYRRLEAARIAEGDSSFEFKVFKWEACYVNPMYLVVVDQVSRDLQNSYTETS